MVSRRSCHAKAQAVAGPSLQLGQTIPEPLRIAENVGMDQYLLIPFLMGWTSIYWVPAILMWTTGDSMGFDTLPCWSMGELKSNGWSSGFNPMKAVRTEWSFSPTNLSPFKRILDQSATLNPTQFPCPIGQLLSHPPFIILIFVDDSFTQFSIAHPVFHHKTFHFFPSFHCVSRCWTQKLSNCHSSRPSIDTSLTEPDLGGTNKRFRESWE